MPLLQLNGKSLYYTRWAAKVPSPSALTVLFIHGLGSSHAFYAPIAAQLATSVNYDLVAFDTYGSGLSKSAGEAQTVASIVQDVEALLECLGISLTRTVVVGHSLGGLVACALASLNLPLGTVAIGPVYPNSELQQVMLSRAEAVQRDGMESLADLIPSAATGSRANPLQKSFIRALLLSQDPDGYASLCRVIANAEEPSYELITTPLLVIAGGEDKVVTVDNCKTIISRIRAKSKLEILPGVGHWHCIENAEAVAESIQNFCDELGA